MNIQSPIEVSSDDFYHEMNRLITQAKKSVWFYSVSACFGFYSKGIHVFENMIKALKDKSEIRHPKYDVRCLVKVDDNGIDLFAADHLRPLNKKRDIVRQTKALTESDNVQFILIDIDTDTPKLLYSNIQESRKTDILGISINKLAGGVFYNYNCESVDRFKKVFDTKWSESIGLTEVVKELYVNRVMNLIRDFDAPQSPTNEACISHNLASYFRGNLGSDIVETERPCLDGRVDIVVGYAERGKKCVGIEVKYGINKQAMDSVIGQATKYKDACEKVIVYSVYPKYTQPEGRRFKKRLEEGDIIYIEIR